MWIMLREGTAARNLKDLLPLVTPENSRRFFFVSDDSHPRELLEVGHVDSIVRKAIALGCNPILAIQMATINTAEFFRLDNLGAIAPGFCADIVVFDQFSRFEITKVFKDGILVSKDGQVARSRVAVSADRKPQSIGSVRIGAIRKDSLVLHSDTPLTKVIQLIPDQIVTKKVMKKATLRDGVAYPDLKQDILKIAVVERHHASGNIGVGFVQGFGLKKGAIGSSVAHDSHNLVVVGTNDEDMWEAIRSLQRLGGGMVAVYGRKMISSVPLPIAGLMANASVRQVHEQMQGLLASAKTLGCKLPDPFMILSFLSLPVIPELKLTDRGLVDVNQFKIVPLFGED
jgi:adenine deaminase